MSGLGTGLAWAASALTGALWSAALAPGAPAVLGLVAPVPLLLALRHAPGVASAWGLALVSGACFWTLHVHWVWPLGGVNLANTIAGFGTLALVFSLFGPLARTCQSAPLGTRWAALAAAWVVVEAFRLHLGFASIPWGSLAYSQVEFVPLAQVAAFGGIYGVCFVLVAIAAGIAEALVLAVRRQRPSGRGGLELALPVALGLAAGVGGALRPTPPATEGLAVGFVQAGVWDPRGPRRETRRDLLDRYREHTLDAVALGAELVVWPASSVPGRVPFDTGLVRYLADLAREVERPLLVGSSGQDKTQPALRERPTANSAFLFAANGEIAQRYDKIRLLPFNEYLPLRGVFEWPRWAGGGGVDATAGEERTVFTAAGARIALLICWENFFPADFGESVRQDVDFVVSMTNEAFTSDARALHQMLTMNRFRAIEGGVPVVRVATTGISTAIDRYGRLGETLPLGADGAGAVTRVPLGATPAPYARLGDWLPALCGLGVAGVLWRGRRNS